MKKLILLLLTISFYTQITFAQNYSSAESVEYDPVNQQWLVSNGSRIIADDGAGNLSYFGMGSGAYGMEVLGNTVFVINNSGLIKGYDLTTEMEVASHNISGSQFLNGMANDGVANLYVTDFSGKRIHRVDVSDITNITSEVIVSNTVSTPNGIVYDGENNRLIFVNWNANATIKAVDLSDNSVSTIITTNLGSIDGIDEDNEGNYYIASWSPSQISKFDKDFANPLEVITTPFINNPADIGYSLQTDTLGIPIGNNVVFVGFEGTTDTMTTDTMTTSLELLDPSALDFKIYPNPINNQSYVQFDLEENSNIQLEILNSTGKSIRTLLEGTQSAGQHKILFAGHNLSPGIYFCRLTVNQKILTQRIVVL